MSTDSRSGRGYQYGDSGALVSDGLNHQISDEERFRIAMNRQ